VFYLVKLVLSNLGVDRRSGSATLGENEISSTLQQNHSLFRWQIRAKVLFFYEPVFSKSTPLSSSAAMLSRTLQLLDRHSALGTPIDLYFRISFHTLVLVFILFRVVHARDVR
jgi:hypothetical protein